MGYLEFYVSPPLVFSGLQKPFKEADYVVLGVPFDGTTTYRSGSRFAPLAIREASLNVETYSFRTDVDLEDLKLHDLGDLHVTGEVDETLKRLQLVTKELLDANKTPAVIGGEHTITLGIMREVGSNSAIVSFDAHLDLRDEYMGRTLSHTTFMRRINEECTPKKILEIGVRAACKEELDYAKKAGIQLLTAQQIKKQGAEKTAESIARIIADCKRVYISIDMDVLDPAFAPAVQNPEPDGLSMDLLLNILCGVCDNQIAGFDVVEVAPHYDRGVTAVQTAKTVFEVLCHLEKSKKTKQ